MSASGSSEIAGHGSSSGPWTQRYGKIPWWPGDTDEVMIGAILTQQTRWENVERALADLKRRGICYHGRDPCGG